MLLDASRNVLSLVDREVSRTRQATGLGRPRLRMVIPPGLPEVLAVPAAARLLTASAALVWNTGLPRPLQQILFETAGSLTAPAPPRPAALVSLATA